MAKGLFTQSTIVLFKRAVPVDELRNALRGFSIRGSRKNAVSGWLAGAEELLLDVSAHPRATVIVDAHPTYWPDHMGHPEQDPELFIAWTEGHFGPHASPKSLERAVEQSWSWREPAGDAAAHTQAFVRIRSTYAVEAVAAAPTQPPASALPEGLSAAVDLSFVTDVAAAVLRLPGALAYFNPNGEVLASEATVAAARARSSKQPGLLPLELWINVRMFKVPAAPGWTVMDTVGMRQLGRLDEEACFARDRYEAHEISLLLRQLTAYTTQHGDVIQTGHTIDGPRGIHWRAVRHTHSLVAPSRPTLRFFPVDGTEPPDALLRSPAPQ